MKKLLTLILQFSSLLFATQFTSVAWSQGSAGGAKTTDPSTWVELGENGTIVARQVLELGDKGLAPTCPAIQITGGATVQMQERGNRPQNFKVVVCEAVIPTGATSASIGSIQLPLPKATINKIVLIGDTGCKGATGPGMKVTPLEEPPEEEEEEVEAAPPSDKSKPGKKQNCLSKSDWPLSTIAKHAADQKPDLVIHVGDYVYVKEEDWAQWYSQFFKPAHDLLLAAPWIFVRGNHEICKLHGQGFFYLLDPRKDTPCANDHSDPYLVKTSGPQFLVMDSSGADCDFAPGELGDANNNKDACDNYDKEIARWTELFNKSKKLLPSGGAFLLTHRPLWGIKPPASKKSPGPGDCKPDESGHILVAINSAMQAAYQKANVPEIKMVLSGHIHNFQLATYKEQGPRPQLVVGDSGVKMSTPPPVIMNDCKVVAQNGSITVSNFYGMKQFGFGVLSGNGTDFGLYAKNGHRALKCTIARQEAKCIAEIVPSKH